MIALLQRVLHASVQIDKQEVAAIQAGLLALIGVRPADDETRARKLAARLLNYRIFSDSGGKMNVSLIEAAGGLLLVPQFTLAADTSRGLRPGFTTAAPPDQARRLFEVLVAEARALVPGVQTGVFGADMQVSLTNDGPVTIWLES